MDRQDIDALLIGALYGELTPADEARLTAHLESHPGDRGALDDLKVARQAVLDSRIFAVQAEPPQAVSALLLQEAHRRAPKRVAAAASDEKESWFFRFTRTFLAHPAMAAAAMLVLVLGGAGIVYMRKGDDQFAARQVEAPAAKDQAVMAPAGNTASLEQGSADGIAAGSAYQAGLYEGNAETAQAEKADEAKPADSAADRWEDQQALDNKKQALAKQEQQRDGELKAKRATSIAIGTEKGAVKELEKPRAKGAKSDDDMFGMGGDSMAAPGAVSGGGGAGAAAPATGAASGRGSVAADKGYAQPPPPPAQVVAAPTATPAPEPKADAKKTAAPAKPAPSSTSTATIAKSPPKAAENTKAESKPDATLIAWAKAEHARAVALAQKGECTSAAKVALSVSSRASEYYAQFMATDRALKQCAQYINAERDKEAEKSSKVRAQKRTNAADEAAPAPTTTK